jgi:hypothetical protein
MKQAARPHGQFVVLCQAASSNDRSWQVTSVDSFAIALLFIFRCVGGATSLRRDVKAGSLCEFAEKEPLLSCKKAG